MQPKLSIIVPTYNRAEMIGTLVRSIFEQSFHDLEIIVVDDGSTDHSREIIGELGKDARNGMEVRYIHQENRGAAAARNLGIRLASGEFLMFADSDDKFAPEGIAKGMKVLESPHVDYVYMPVQVVDGEWHPAENPILGHVYDLSDRDLIGYHWHTMGAIYRSELITRVGFWREDLSCSEDWEYHVRVKLASKAGVFVNSFMGYWRIHDGERLSLHRFRSAYVDSVHRCCLSIAASIQRAGRFSLVVRSRLTNRLIRHALEAGANGDSKLRNDILRTCWSLAPGMASRVCVKVLMAADLRMADKAAYLGLTWFKSIASGVDQTRT